MLDDADRFEEAFFAYERANRMYRDSRAALGERFDAAELHREIDETIATFTRGILRRSSTGGAPPSCRYSSLACLAPGRAGGADRGQPFTGVGAGELREIGNLAQQLDPIIAAIQSGSEEGMAEVGAEQRTTVRRLSDAHLEHLKALNGHAERVIDKMPDNVFKLGAIATLFTGARVIFCRRDPLDTCLSCYFQKFTAGQLGFSYDLADAQNAIWRLSA